MTNDSQADVAASSAESNLESVLERLTKSTTSRENPSMTSESIGRYTVLGEVGRGGMGAIFKVRDEEMRRTLAMKVVLNPGRSEDPTIADDLDSARIIRFLEEAQVTGQLDHPGIVPVHELGLDNEGHNSSRCGWSKGARWRTSSNSLTRRVRAGTSHAQWV